MEMEGGVVRGFERREGKSLLCLQGKCCDCPFRSVRCLLDEKEILLFLASSSPGPFIFFPPSPFVESYKIKKAQQKGSCDAVVPGVDVIYFPQLLLWKPGVDRAVL